MFDRKLVCLSDCLLFFADSWGLSEPKRRYCACLCREYWTGSIYTYFSPHKSRFSLIFREVTWTPCIARLLSLRKSASQSAEVQHHFHALNGSWNASSTGCTDISFCRFTAGTTTHGGYWGRGGCGRKRRRWIQRWQRWRGAEQAPSKTIQVRSAFPPATICIKCWYNMLLVNPTPFLLLQIWCGLHLRTSLADQKCTRRRSSLAPRNYSLPAQSPHWMVRKRHMQTAC